MSGVAVAGFDEDRARKLAARFGYELTNQVQGHTESEWFFAMPCSLPFWIGSGASVLRVLALHERWAACGNRARIDSWRAQKRRFPNGRPLYGVAAPAKRRGP